MGNTFDLDRATLAPVVERLLGAGAIIDGDFEVIALKPGLGNPTSLGVYRVAGKALSNGKPVPFSMVVKHLADGQPIMDASEPTYWNYWKREIAFFESPLANRIPKSIDFPMYLGQSALPDGTMLFWNSDLGDLQKAVWSWAECLHAAALVAELNTMDISDTADFDWLNRDQLEAWLTFRADYMDPLYPKTLEQVHAAPEDAADFGAFSTYLPMMEELVSLLATKRRTFTHGDFNLNNLVPRSYSNSRIIALDWQLAGTGALGSEIASIFNTAQELGVIQPSAELFSELCEAYVRKFNSVAPNSPCTVDEVRLNAAAQGFVILIVVGYFISQPEPNNTDAQNQAKIRGLVDYWLTGPMGVYAKILDELSGL